MDLNVSLLHEGDVQLSPLEPNKGQPIRRFNHVRPATDVEKAETGVLVPGALLVYWTGLNGFPDGAGVWPGYDPITVLRADLIIEEEL